MDNFDDQHDIYLGPDLPDGLSNRLPQPGSGSSSGNPYDEAEENLKRMVQQQARYKESAHYDDVPVGKHSGRIVTAESGKTRDGSAYCIVLGVQLDSTKAKGLIARWQLTLSDKAAGYYYFAVQSCLPEYLDRDPSVLVKDPSPFIGIRVEIKVYESYSGYTGICLLRCLDRGK